MILKLLLITVTICLNYLFMVAALKADEPFSVIVPDSDGQQVRHLSVHADDDGVSIHNETPLKLTFEPKSIAVHPNGKQLIIGGRRESNVPVATVEVKSISELNLIESSTVKYPSDYTSIDRRGRHYLTVNYHRGIVAVYHLNDRGGVGAEVSIIKTPKTAAHCILTTRDNRFAYVPCVKTNNAIYQYSFNETTGQLTALAPLNANPPSMFGPRHVAYHPRLPIAYFSNEQQLGVSVYGIGEDGRLTDKQHAVTMPRRTPFEQGKRDLHASDLAVTEDGKWLFVAVRDFNGDEDSIFSFRIEADGRLSQTARTMVGDVPWKLNLSPSGNSLLVSETGDQRLSIYHVLENGTLSLACQTRLPANVRDLAVLEAR